MNETLDRDKTCALIRKMCTDRGITTETLAEALNVSRQTVYAWFSSRKMPTIDHLVEIASLLDLTVDELIARRSYDSGG